MDEAYSKVVFIGSRFAVAFSASILCVYLFLCCIFVVICLGKS